MDTNEPEEGDGGATVEPEAVGAGPSTPTASPADDDSDGGASRRTLIDLAVRRRDDLTIDSLRRVLSTLDVEVDPKTLEGDLTKLDIEQRPQPDGRVVLRHAGSPADPAPDNYADDDGFYPTEDERPIRNPMVLGAIGVGVVLFLVIVALVAFHGNGTKKPNALKNNKNHTPLTRQPRPGLTIPKAPVGPGSDPALSLTSDHVDHFDTNGIGLGTYPGVGPWKVAAGEWAVLKNEASLIKADQTHGNLVYFDTGSADLRAQVNVVNPGPGAGLAFRVVDAQNYWLWTVSPYYSIVILDRVQNGKVTAVVNSGLVRIKKGQGIVLGVSTSGKTIQLLVDGAVVKTVADPTAKPGTGLGLGALTKVKGSTFDDMVFKKTA